MGMVDYFIKDSQSSYAIFESASKGKRTMTVCFVILHYNVLEETVKCIKSISELKRPSDTDLQIIVVDNYSPNNTGKILQEKYKETENVTVLLNKKNQGFSRGNNLGYQYAKENFSSDYMIIANNDIEFVQDDFLLKLPMIYERMQFAVLGPDIQNTCTGKHQNPISSRVPDKKQVNKTIFLNGLVLKCYHIFYPIMKKYFEAEAYETENTQYLMEQQDTCIMGACMILSKRYLQLREKAFEPETNFYYEEYLMKLWCERNHEKMCYTPELMVLHNHGKATDSEKNQKKKIYFRMKNIYDSAKIYKHELIGDMFHE